MLFRKPRTFILDLDTLSDPRIVRFLQLGLVSGTLLVPEPGSDTDLRNQRARETIAALRKIKGITVKSDARLRDRASLAAALKKHKALLLTTIPDLVSLGTDQVVVLTEIYNLFRPQFLPGAEVRVRVAKKGKEKNEGIGYLDGGIKLVIENAADLVGQDIEVVVQGNLDTNLGRIVFARPKFVELK